MEIKKLSKEMKLLIVLFTILISYSILTLVFKPLLIPTISERSSMRDVMARMMSYSSQNELFYNVIFLLLAVAVGILVYSNLKTEKKVKKSPKEQAFKIIKKSLSEDDRRILAEIEKAGKITQDSLRFRLGWSKAKVSTILTKLDKMNLIQRERIGKTYRVFLSKNIK